MRMEHGEKSRPPPSDTIFAGCWSQDQTQFFLRILGCTVAEVLLNGNAF